MNDSKWGVQISIINVDYLSSGEEAGISTCTGGTTSVTDKDLCFRLVYFFHSVSLSFFATQFSGDVYVQLSQVPLSKSKT